MQIRSLIFLKIYPKIVKNAYLRIPIFKISQGSMPPEPLEGARAGPRRDRYAITSFGVLEFHAPPPPPPPWLKSWIRHCISTPNILLCPAAGRRVSARASGRIRARKYKIKFRAKGFVRKSTKLFAFLRKFLLSEYSARSFKCKCINALSVMIYHHVCVTWTGSLLLGCLWQKCLLRLVLRERYCVWHDGQLEYFMIYRQWSGMV